MDAIVMCGGRGTRLESEAEKPLYEVAGVPMIDRVRSALASARRVDTVHAVVSPHVPATREHLEREADRERLVDREERTIDAPGDGYVTDLQYALDRVDTPVLTVAADLPLLSGPAIDDVLEGIDRRTDRSRSTSVTICVPAALKRVLDVSADTTIDDPGAALAPTGVNIVGEGNEDLIHTTWDVRFAVNVNYRSDARLAEELL